ncbi:hypothetical protein Prudu_35S000500 [Prunus dulcis]|uniref:B-like cyclin n=1 Tax=Prunus dulcis TaxID=3755 RepID=A0A5H2XJS9_PRUDU|nr:hypothetical protein Prudu_35S000500 [Prunus dulcis]
MVAAQPKFSIGPNGVGKENLTRTSDASKKMLGFRGYGIKTMSVSSRRSFLGKGQESPSQGVSRLQTSKRGPSDNQRTKAMGLGRESVAADGRRTSRNTLKLIRKSLPVLKVNPEETSIPKENAGSSENAEEKSGYYVRAKVGRTVVPRVSNNARSHLLQNRVSDGFMNIHSTHRLRMDSLACEGISLVMPGEFPLGFLQPFSKKGAENVIWSALGVFILAFKGSKGSERLEGLLGQANSNTRVLPRISVRPILKSTLNTSESQRTLKSKCASGPKKLVSATATSSKTEKVVTSFLPENVKHDSTQGELPSDGKCSHSVSSTISRRNSNRRRSYTSLLMTGSKLLEERDEAMKQEELPSIDDDCNQLEVSDYVDEIYQYYWVSEVHFKFELMQETLYLMVTLLDQYLSQVTIKKDEMQLVGLTALLLASKYEDFLASGPVQALIAVCSSPLCRKVHPADNCGLDPTALQTCSL